MKRIVALICVLAFAFSVSVFAAEDAILAWDCDVCNRGTMQLHYEYSKWYTEDYDECCHGYPSSNADRIVYRYVTEVYRCTNDDCGVEETYDGGIEYARYCPNTGRYYFE